MEKSLKAQVDVKQKLILCLSEKYKKYVWDVKVIPCEHQLRLVVIDLNKRVLKKIVRKEPFIRRKTWKLNENQTRARFKNRVNELVSTDTPNLWKAFKDRVLKACDEVCGKKKSRRDRGDMWLRNEEVKDAIARKKPAFKELCRLPSEKYETKYKPLRSQSRKIVTEAIRKEAKQELNDLYQDFNSVFCYLKRIEKKVRILKKEGFSSSFELFVVSFAQEDVYIGHTALALTLGLQVFI